MTAREVEGRARAATCWALLPVKDFSRAKGRLSPRLSPQRRVALARGLFEHVTTCLMSSPGIAHVLVLTDCPEVMALAAQRNCSALRDQPGACLNEIVDAGLVHAAKAGAARALVCMSDLPLLQPSEVDAFCAALDQADLVLGPDHRDAGTNALGLHLPAGFGSCFGHVDSMQRHLDGARALELRVRVLGLTGVRLDLDEPSDLEGARLGAETAGLSLERLMHRV